MPEGVKMKSQGLSCQRSHVSFITQMQRCIYKPYGYNLSKTESVNYDRGIDQRGMGAQQNTLSACLTTLKMHCYSL